MVILPSGEHTKSYWKWPFIVDFPIKNCDFPLLCVCLKIGKTPKPNGFADHYPY